MSATVEATRRRAWAADGAYGTRSYDRVAEHADALLADIEEHLADAPSFTREDLLHLPTLQHVATITRYRYAADAVKMLVDKRKLLRPGNSRTDLCIAGHARGYVSPLRLQEQYAAAIERLARTAIEAGGEASVWGVARAWTADQHLTDNTKRVITREVLRALARDGKLVRVGPGLYGPRDTSGG